MMTSISACLRTLGYLTTLGLFFGVVYKQEKLDYDSFGNANVTAFGQYKYRYLTTWNFFLLAGHAMLSLCCEYLFIKNARNKIDFISKLIQFRDTVFSSCVVPNSICISAIFWSVYMYDRELILPGFMDDVLPPFENHSLHTYIVPAVLMEIALLHDRKPGSHMWNCFYLTCFLAVWGLQYLGIFLVTGRWLYPVCEHLSYLTLAVTTIVLWSFFLSIYFLQWPLGRALGKEWREKKKNR